MVDLSKNTSKKVYNNVTVEDLNNSSGTSSTDLPNCDNYYDPSRNINGNISYLLELEDLPQGRHLGVFSTIVLFVSRILGSGIFSVSSGIYDDCGRSPFYFFLAWLIASIMAFFGLYVYLELGSLVPRSGGTKVFLEFIYEKPKMLATVVFLLFSVVFGFTITNIIVFGEYFLRSLGLDATKNQSRFTGLIFLYCASLIHGLSVSHGVRLQNILGGLKMGLLFLMFLSALYVLIFPSSVTGLESHLHWDTIVKPNSSISISKFASGVLKALFAFSGWSNVHTVSSEVRDPIRTFRIAGPTSLIIITISYFFTNLAYLTVLTDQELVSGGTLVGSIYFEKLFGYRLGKQLLTLAVALCAGGNVLVVLYTISRSSQEVFREGYLPFSRIMSSNWPFDAPLPTLILSCALSTLVIMLSLQADIYNYIVALEGYLNQFFIGLTALGIFIIRSRYPNLIAPIRSSLFGTVFILGLSLYLLISPFITNDSPNPSGMENWPSYALVAIVALTSFWLFWLFKFYILPNVFNYKLIQEETQLEDGLVIKKWIKCGI